jgi:glycosyltransferase involved in cell wall biosynthesis
VSVRLLQFIIPGSLSQATGGYHYDRRLIAGLGVLGWRVEVRSLDAGFPFPDRRALMDANEVLASIPDDELAVVDGLALGAMPEVLANHASRLRLIALIHHPLALESGLSPAVADQLRRSEEAALRCVRHVIVTSAFTREALVPYGVDRSRVSVVEPGTDVGVAPASALRARARPARGGEPTRHDGTQLLCVATITARKGHDVLIEALASLRHFGWRLVCVGSTTRSSATVEALHRQIAAAGLGDRVSVVGELDPSALEQSFAAADLFVLPTLYEGYGMVVAEALAHGLPVIATRTGAIADLVLPDAGYVVKPGDPKELCEALSRVLTDEAVYTSFAEGAYSARERLPTWAAASERAAAVLDAVRVGHPGGLGHAAGVG